VAGSKPEIGAKIVLDGAEEYQRSLKEVANAQKDLNKEMKLAESEFKKTGDAQQLYNEKVRLLNAQMDNQKKKLETAQKALKELSDKGVDKNSDLWRKWNGILLDSQTKMNNLQAELNSTTAAMKDTADATEQVTQATERATQETADYSGTLKSIDKGVKFQNVLKGLGLIKDAVGAVISTAYRMGKALVMSQISGGDWAREIMMGAAKAGVSVEEYQARLYAQAVGGINTDAITEGIKKTTENLATTDTELLKLYNDLGISTRNADGTVRDATETFWASVDALKGIEDQTTRSIYAQKLLGDQYLELRGLVDLGSEGYEKLIEEGKASATVTEESVNALADMDAAYEKTSATAQSLMHNINAELAPGFTEMAGAFTEVLQEFDEFLKSEDGQRVFNNWNATLSGIATTIKETDFTAAFEVISGALDGIVAAFEAAFKTALAVKEIIDWFSTNEDLRDFLGIAPKDESSVPTIDLDSMSDAKKEHLLDGYVVKVEGYTPPKPQTNEDLIAAAEELKKAQQRMISAYIKDDYAKIAAEMESIFENRKKYNQFLKSDELVDRMGALIDTVNAGGTPNSPETYKTIMILLDEVNAVMAEATKSAESGGGSAMNAFNAAIEKGTADTKNTLKSGVTAAFSGFDSVFASMGAAHGAAYINALSAQMSRINSLLSLSPSYAYGGTFYNPAQSAYASPTSTANVSLYVGREKFGQLTTPIIDARMGADLMTVR
jgi:hypothetical protein